MSAADISGCSAVLGSAIERKWRVPEALLGEGPQFELGNSAFVG